MALMYLDPKHRVRMGPPGALHHARFMSKNRYYLRLMLLIKKATDIMDLSQSRIDEIKAMALYISIFHVPKFLSAEKSDIAAAQDVHAIWQMHQMMRVSDKLAEPISSVLKSLERHMWYLDPTTVVFALANTDMTVSDAEKTVMAQKLYAFSRPEEYDFSRKNNTGFMPSKEFFLKDMQPSLDLFITPESWLVFEMLGHSKEQVKWMLYPPEHWDVDPDYQEFKAFVKKIAVVNDAGERAVKAVQDLVMQTTNEIKLQKMLVVKSKLQKSRGRTKAAYRAAAEQLTPAEQVQAAFELEELANEEQEVSSGESELEEGSSIDFLQEGEVEQALLEENETVLNAEMG